MELWERSRSYGRILDTVRSGPQNHRARGEVCVINGDVHYQSVNHFISGNKAHINTQKRGTDREQMIKYGSIQVKHINTEPHNK